MIKILLIISYLTPVYSSSFFPNTQVGTQNVHEEIRFSKEIEIFYMFRVFQTARIT